MKIVCKVVALLAVIAFALGDCPSYDSIVQPEGQKFDPQIYQGIWYEIATDEPTQPQFCQCATLNWTVTGPTTFQDSFSANCSGYPIAFNLAGSLSSDPDRPGNLKEGPASWAEVTNMVFNLTLDVAPDGQLRYAFARVYSCLGLGLYSLQILSRQPVVPVAQVQQMLAEVAAIGIDTSKVKIYDFSACPFAR